MKKIAGFTAALVAMVGISAAQTTLISDDFESYADTAAMLAAWTVGGTVPDPVPYTLGEDVAPANKFLVVASATGAAVLSRTFPSATPTDDEPITLEYDLRAATYANSRMSVGLRPVFDSTVMAHIGTHNGTGDNKFFTRTLGGGAPDYVALVSGPDRTPGVWTTLSLTLGTRDIVAAIDGTDATEAIGRTTADWPAITTVRVGYGNSWNQDGNIDNILVTQVEASSVSDWHLMK